MKNIYILFLLVSLGQIVNGQKVPLKAITEKLKSGQFVTANDFGFKEYAFIQKGDTTKLYTYQKKNTNPTSIYLYLPGSNAENIYTYHKENDSSYWYNSLTSFDFSYLPENYLFVIVAKPGFGFINNSNSNSIPQKYWDMTSLQDRVMRASASLDYVKKNILKKAENVVAFGYSEGFYVGAKLATVNKSITHLGIGGGGAYSDSYDFILSNLKASNIGEIKVDSAIQYNSETIADLREIVSNPTSSKDFKMGYTFKRWASFSEPAINNLVGLKIPIFQFHGALDESTPIESAYAVPVEFARLKKNNLTFTVYSNCDHSLIERTDKKEIEHWDEMLISFFNWVKSNSKK